jgi:hypothetical protein
MLGGNSRVLHGPLIFKGNTKMRIASLLSGSRFSISALAGSRRGVLSLAALVAAAGSVGTVNAQPCSLQVKASPQVILSGQSAKVDVFARFPATAFAFAAAQFDVEAEAPAWNFVTGGAIVGSGVFGIAANQSHMPQVGVIADPMNPYHAWTGRFVPASNAPALITIKANPTDFWYYPSALTSSPVQCAAGGGEARVLINPLRLGNHLAAAAAGDSLRVTPNGFVASSPDSETLIGLLLPIVQKVRESETTLNFESRPTSFEATVEVNTSVPIDSYSLNFAKIEFRSSPSLPLSYLMSVQIPDAIGVRLELIYPNGSVESFPARDGQFPVRFMSIPTRLKAELIGDLEKDTRAGGGTIEIQSFSWGVSNPTSSTGMQVLMADGSVRTVRSAAVREAARRIPSGNNLKQIGLALHSFRKVGPGTLTISQTNQ